MWLGICGVGSLVLASGLVLGLKVPQQLLSTERTVRFGDLYQLTMIAGLFVLWLLPFDFLGGYYLPKAYRKSFMSFQLWVRKYLKAALSQSLLFVLCAVLLLTAGRIAGLLGGLIVVGAVTVTCFFWRHQLMRAREVKSSWSAEKLAAALKTVSRWQISAPPLLIVKHDDIGFTGGISGLGKNVCIVLPQAWLNAMSQEELATAIARRTVAIRSGSYHQGLRLAFTWNIAGFAICSFLPGAGLDSVATLVTTFCGFTVWSFLGLLILPTVSRRASLQIDHLLREQGVPADLIKDTAHSLDEMQDGEPHRPSVIETIFHPIPSVSRRNSDQASRGLSAWQVARTTLFFSWACCGVLSRAVHCNIGRPELWTMLPSD